MQQSVEQKQVKWSELDKEELKENVAIEEPCEAKEMIVPLNEKQITIETKNHKEKKIFPRDWLQNLNQLDKDALDIIAQAGSLGQKSEVAHTRQIIGSSLPVLPNAYTRLGELFQQNANKSYPPVNKDI